MVVGLFHFYGVEDHLANLGCKLRRLQVGVFFQNGEDQVDSELQVQRLVANNPVDERTEVTQQVALAEAQRDHEAGVEPNSLEDDVVGHEVTDKVLLTLGGGDIQSVFGHALDELDLELFLARHRGHVDVAVVGLVAINREGFENIFEAHAVVGFFPHLLREVKVRLGSIDVGVDAEGEGLVDQEFARVEVAHQEGDGVTLFVSHFLEVSDVFAQLNLVGEPRVRYSLVIQVHCPAVGHRLEQQAFFNSGSKNSHDVLLWIKSFRVVSYWQLSH